MTSTQHPAPPALILIDIQKGFDTPGYYGGHPRNNPEAEQNAHRILEHWRQRQWPLFHFQHCSVKPGSPLAESHPGNAIKDEVKPLPGEPLIKKSVNSAFIGTNLKERLDAQGITDLVIIGLTTQHCVSTTVRMAGNLGFDAFVAADACAAQSRTGYDGKQHSAQMVHDVALANLHGEFAEVTETARILQALQD